MSSASGSFVVIDRYGSSLIEQVGQRYLQRRIEILDLVIVGGIGRSLRVGVDLIEHWCRRWISLMWMRAHVTIVPVSRRGRQGRMAHRPGS